ncbi:MAG TPA: hypothetical protein VIJ34_05770 [Acidimicrobiales bacterium]
MPDWRATRPVDVARLNSSIFLAVLRKYGVAFVFLTPPYLLAAILLGEHRFPTHTPGQILAAAIPLFLTGVVSHLFLGLVAVMFIVTVGSLIWWRHVLAVGGLVVALAALLSALRRIVSQFEHRVDPSLLATALRRQQATLGAPIHDLLDQLRVSLLAASDAPPLPTASACGPFGPNRPVDLAEDYVAP